VLIYTHRWLGIAGSLIFLVWFGSGVVMMYERMPRLTPEERLARLVPLDVSRIGVSLADAIRTVGVVPERARVGMLNDRPVYRLDTGSGWTTVFADSGEPLRALSTSTAVQIVRRMFPEAARTLRPAGRLTRPDQWTLDGGLPRFLPMQRVALGDPDDTIVYVSERVGEPVMKTTRRGRMFGYAGAVLHWTYFTPFRIQRELWRYSIIYAALIGSVLCLSGLVIGVWRFSPFKRFRLRRIPSRSPYARWMWWHHYAGLLFGLFTFTWALSGALSLTPWDWAPPTDASAEQRVVASGGALRAELVSPAAIRLAVQRVSREFPVKEWEVLQFAGRPFALAYQPDSLHVAKRSSNRDVSAIMSAQRAHRHLSVWLDAPDAVPFERLDRQAVASVGRAAMPGVPVADATWLDHYDEYYYDRTSAKPLPVLRVTYADAQRTALYFDAQTGMISMRQTTLSRVNRWLYNGLHSFDFPSLYYQRPGWDVVVLGLSFGGIALTLTTMMPAIHRLRRHVRHFRSLYRG
jgi:hypothetical protein